MTGPGDRTRAGGGLFWGSGVYISLLGMGLCRSDQCRCGACRSRLCGGVGARVRALNCCSTPCLVKNDQTPRPRGRGRAEHLKASHDVRGCEARERQRQGQPRRATPTAERGRRGLRRPGRGRGGGGGGAHIFLWDTRSQHEARDTAHSAQTRTHDTLCRVSLSTHTREHNARAQHARARALPHTPYR